jgi:hypothetical protein
VMQRLLRIRRRLRVMACHAAFIFTLESQGHFSNRQVKDAIVTFPRNGIHVG